MAKDTAKSTATLNIKDMISSLASLSHADLATLSGELQKTMETRAVEMKNQMRAQFEAFVAQKGKEAAAFGFSIEDITSPESPPKFRNPKNPEETWKGKGRKPTWLQDLLDKGHKLEEFAIPETADQAAA